MVYNRPHNRESVRIHPEAKKEHCFGRGTMEAYFYERKIDSFYVWKVWY